MSRVSKQQIKEWVDNPVTLTLKFLCMRELNNAKSVTASDCLYAGDPQKTHDNLLVQTNKEFEWTTFLDLLAGEWKDQLGDLENYDKLVEEYDEDSDESEDE